ncbi:MAG: glycosyl hydrolase family 38, partial [Bacteroidales bacterium]|nr:glycosyl hydrolase family 38 [Bacteroidales bacterium]
DVRSYDFHLHVNGEKYLTFSNPESNEKLTWSIKGKDGAELTFNVTLIDNSKDQMGFATLKLPKSAIVPGKPVTLEISGEDAGSNIWYMTFKSGICEEITVSQENVVLNENGKLYHIVNFGFTHLGEETATTVTVGNVKEKIILKPGSNALDLMLPKVDVPTEYTAKIKIGGNPELEKRFKMNPVKEWTIYLVQHTHTDIGYTRPQTEILPEHLRYIDYALDFCDLTDDYPDHARFRWTCEASWAVREYLKSRPEKQIERFLKRIDEGRIEVTGMFFNYSEIVDETCLAAQTLTLSQFKAKGIHVSVAMQNDVNGIGWCLADYFQGTGVKYLIMGQHGHRARVPFQIPTAFWWESPSGNRLLAFRSEHYMHGNKLGLLSGDIKVFRKEVSGYLGDLEGKGYPFLHTAFQFSGYSTDNSPPSTIACDMVKEWNEKYEWPKLEIAVASEFMNYLEENHSENLPVHKVAWPDWWTDGFGSAMNETKAVRTTHSDMIANTGLLSMAKIMGAELPEDLNHDISAIQDAMLFYDEHTYGAAESISDPLAENSVIQWNEKAAYAWEAVKKSRMLREKAMGYIQPYIDKSDVPTIAIFNTLNWERSGLVTVYIDHEILPGNKEFEISDFQGNKIAAQALDGRTDGTYWGLWVENIPAMGYKLYRIEVSDGTRLVDRLRPVESVFENDFYKLELDAETGVITSIFDKELQLELVDKRDTVKMGQFIYEKLANRHQMERFTHGKMDTVYVPLEGERYCMTD